MSGLSDQRLQVRKSGIGGSDVAAVLGISPYRSPMDVWLEKTGRVDAEFTPDQEERMHWGTVLEDVVAREYASREHCKVQRINPLLRHPKYDIALANIDRVRVTNGSRARWNGKAITGADRLIEIKTTSQFANDWGEPGTDQIPDTYILQTQWYMGITGLEVADVPVLIGGQRMELYHVAADQDLFESIIDQCAEWWQRHIVNDEAPAPRTEDEAKALWAAHKPGKVVVASSEVEAAVCALRRVKSEIKSLEETEKRLRNEVTCAIGDAESIVGVDSKPLATWKANKLRTSIDWKGIAEELGPPTSETISKHTTEKPGARVLRLAKP